MVYTRIKKKISFFLIILLISIPACAERIQFSADSMTSFSRENYDYTKLTGNAKVITPSMEIFSDTIEIYGNDLRYISASGNVQGKNKDSCLEFSCISMDYDRETKIATLKDNVHLIDSDNDVIADAQLVEYNSNTETAIMQISVTITQKDNICSAAHVLYYKNEQILNMSGNPQVQQGKDTFRAQEIRLNLDTKEISLDGRVKGTINSEKTEKGGENKELEHSNDDADSPAPTKEDHE